MAAKPVGVLGAFEALAPQQRWALARLGNEGSSDSQILGAVLPFAAAARAEGMLTNDALDLFERVLDSSEIATAGRSHRRRVLTQFVLAYHLSPP